MIDDDDQEVIDFMDFVYKISGIIITGIVVAITIALAYWKWG